LACLVRDFLEDYTDWEAGAAGSSAEGEPRLSPSENYKNTFAAARNFVLPMNPPRLELDRAVRLIFAEHGITVKKSRFNEKSRSGRAEEVNVPAAGEDGSPVPAKRRRHRRRRKPSQPVTPSAE
jgi:poly(A) polymerase